MNFMNPFFLLAAAGIALPILAHLLNKQEYQETDWAAMQFLNRTIRIQSRQIKIKDILLLILRCLALLFLVLAVSRPVTENSSSFVTSIGQRRAGVVIALDASFSMKHKDKDNTRFERAVEKIKSIMKNLTPGDPITLVLLGAEHNVIIRNRKYEPEIFSKIIDDLKPTPEALDLDSIPRKLKELLNELEAPQKEVFLITDVQNQDWEQGAERLRNALKDLSKNADLFLIPVTGGKKNLAISNFELISGVLRKKTTARYSVTVNNYDELPVNQVKVSGQLNNITVDSKVIPNIPPGSAKTLSLFIPFQDSGPARISAKIGDDGLNIDNTRRTMAVIRDKVSILCVEGSSQKSGFRGFSTDALEARDEEVDEKDFKVKPISWDALPGEDLDSYDVVVLSDVPAITEDQAKRLDKFVRKGNGLIWFPGENTKIDLWNKRSVQEGSPLLPAEIGEVVSAADSMGVGRPLNPNIPEHTVSSPLLSLSEDLLSEARFLKRVTVNPHPASTTILTVAGSGDPVLLEHSLGRGQVFMFTSSSAPVWNTMALTPIFPMLMQQMVTYLTAREFEKPRTVGSSLSLSYVEKPDASEAVFKTPSKETILVPVQQFRNQYRAQLGHAKEVGYYEARASMQSPSVPIAVNVDTRESNVSCIEGPEQEKLFKNSGVQIIKSDEQLTQSIIDSRKITSLWRLCAIICFIIIIMESLLACRLPKSQNLQTAPAAGGGNA
jgi:uncharacterized membrane protein